MVKIGDLELSGKRVLVREDYNVPLKDGAIEDDTRIRASLPTLTQLLEAGARIIIVSHLGRPEAGEYDAALSLAPVARRLSELLGKEVPLARDWLDGVDTRQSEVVLCENARFHKGERDNDDEMARKMAGLCNVYVNDAFATAHRAHASTHGVAKYAPVAAAGPLLIAELEFLSRALKEPARPLVAIVGGAKISSKLILLSALAKKVDHLILGGGIANTFLKAAGFNVGNSLHEAGLVNEARRLLRDTETGGADIVLPVDAMWAKQPHNDPRVHTIDALHDDDMILDVGPVSVAKITELLHQAQTIVWNGPLGVFEYDSFAGGTGAMAHAIAASDAFSIAGGGDTLAAIAKFGVADKISYISTAGGAFLQFLEGRELPAVAILEEAARAWKAMERAREY